MVATCFEVVTAIRALGCEFLNLCVWVKTNRGMGSLYRSRHELVFVFGKRGGAHVNNVQLGKHGRNRTKVWNYPGMNSARGGRTRGLDLHPTVKPIVMVSDAILDVTQRGDIVLDPFCGGGTTILAAGRDGAATELTSIQAMWIPPSRAGSARRNGPQFRRAARPSKKSGPTAQMTRSNPRGGAHEIGGSSVARWARGRRRRRPGRQESTLDIMERLLIHRVSTA